MGRFGSRGVGAGVTIDQSVRGAPMLGELLVRTAEGKALQHLRRVTHRLVARWIETLREPRFAASRNQPKRDAVRFSGTDDAFTAPLTTGPI